VTALDLLFAPDQTPYLYRVPLMIDLGFCL
jgi:hypothetical protein